jgi:hypothetical protein
MPQQNYANHQQWVPMYHYVLSGLIVVGLIGAAVNLFQSIGDHQRIYSASLILLIFVAMLILFIFTRAFPMKVQNRAIRAEESLRHYVLTGKLPDPSLTMGQILALRFASDEEYVALSQKAVRERLTPDAIKRAVQKWRPDFHRA